MKAETQNLVTVIVLWSEVTFQVLCGWNDVQEESSNTLSDVSTSFAYVNVKNKQTI